MDKTTKYRRIIVEKLCNLANFINQHARSGQFEASAVIDEERDQYLLVKTSWSGQRRVRGMTLYLRLRNGQIWVEEDWTEHGISGELAEAGVAEEDIVLAFQSPQPRLLSEATA